jgi:hypothetical protein
VGGYLAVGGGGAACVLDGVMLDDCESVARLMGSEAVEVTSVSPYIEVS